jgi:hypothetical protein
LKASRSSRQRFRCKRGGHVFELGYGKGVVSREERAVVRESLERGSVRILARRFSRSKTTVMEMVHRVTKRMARSLDVAQALLPVWGGVLVVDGKYVRTKTLRSLRADARIRDRNLMSWICSVDAWTGDLPHYQLGDEETMVDLVLYFKRLKELGYELRVLVSDGNPDFARAARKVYGEHVLFQLCTRHFVEGLRRKAREEGMQDDAQTTKFIFAIQRVIEAATLEEVGQRLVELKRLRARHPVQRLLLEDFKQHADALTTHLQHPDLHIPHTTNDTENIFRQLMLRLKSLGQFMHWTHAETYLNAWALYRRFTPFTDCRGSRKHRNGKTPLQCANARLDGVDMFEIPRGKQP